MMSAESKKKHSKEEPNFDGKRRQMMDEMQKALDGEKQMKKLLLRKVTELTERQQSIEQQVEKVENLKLERDELVEVLRQQKGLLEQYDQRDSDKVKKLKMQKNELMKSKQKLIKQLENIDMTNRNMTDKIAKLNSELEQVKLDRDYNLSMISVKDEKISKLQSRLAYKYIEEAAMKENWQLIQKSFKEEEQRQNWLLAEKENISYDLKDEIATLEEKLIEKEVEQAIKRGIFTKFKLPEETILTLVCSEFEAKRTVDENKSTIIHLKNEIVNRDDQIAYKQKENEALKENFSALQKVIEEAEIKRNEIEIKMQYNKAVYEKKLKTIEMDLKQAKEVTEISEQMLHKSERKNNELQDVNEGLKEHVSMDYAEIEEKIQKLGDIERKLLDSRQTIDAFKQMLDMAVKANIELSVIDAGLKEQLSKKKERILEIEADIKDITKMWNSGKISSEELSEDIALVEDHVKILQEQLSKKKMLKLRKHFANP